MKKNAGFTLIELMIVVAIIAIIAAIAIPNLLRSRLSANESATIGNLRTLCTAQIAFHAANSRYGTNAELVAATPPFIDASFGAAVVKSGYTIGAYALGASNQSFSVSAVPVTIGTTGNRGFMGDDSGAIRASADGSAPTTASPVIGTVTAT